MAVKYYPNSGKHINIGASCMAQFQSVGWAPFTSINVYRTVEGKARELITSGMSTVMGTFDAGVEVNPLSGLYAKTADGRFTGDDVTITFENAMMPVEQVNWECFCNPGYTRETRDLISVDNVTKLSATSSEVQPQSTSTTPTGGTSSSATEIGMISLGECCPCSAGGTQGETPDSNSANGGPHIETPLVNILSRGLPIRIKTSYAANERFVGPWGWNRSLGIYRKLLEQNPVTYYEHVSILKQDASRVSYVKKDSTYESSSGSYDSLRKTDSGWFEKTKEGIYYEYNAHGNLKRALDANRNEHYYLYDDNTSTQKLLEIKAPKGLRPYFYYDDSLNTRIALRDPSDSSKNKYVYFKYDGSDYMTKAVGPEGCQWYFEYDSGRISKITDPDGYETEFGFDGAG